MVHQQGTVNSPAVILFGNLPYRAPGVTSTTSTYVLHPFPIVRVLGWYEYYGVGGALRHCHGQSSPWPLQACSRCHGTCRCRVVGAKKQYHPQPSDSSGSRLKQAAGKSDGAPQLATPLYRLCVFRFSSPTGPRTEDLYPRQETFGKKWGQA